MVLRPISRMYKQKRGGANGVTSNQPYVQAE